MLNFEEFLTLVVEQGHEIEKDGRVGVQVSKNGEGRPNYWKCSSCERFRCNVRKVRVCEKIYLM